MWVALRSGSRLAASLGYALPQLAASRNAPPAAANTEKSSGAFTPSANVIVTAKDNNRRPAASANHRNCQPMSKPIARITSATVDVQARIGIEAGGANQLSLAT